jgi:hypothetical protein
MIMNQVKEIKLVKKGIKNKLKKKNTLTMMNKEIQAIEVKRVYLMNQNK